MANEYVNVLIEKYKSRGLLIDANLLLLYLVGSYDLRLIGNGTYNKLSKYTTQDFEQLLLLKSFFKKAVTTAHVLTEVSNLTGDLPESIKSKCLSEFCQTLSEMDELPIPSFEAAQRPEFHYLGLTDCAIAQVAKLFLIVTDDARFVNKLNGSGLEALNFNHIRTYLFA